MGGRGAVVGGGGAVVGGGGMLADAFRAAASSTAGAVVGGGGMLEVMEQLDRQAAAKREELARQVGLPLSASECL